MTSDGDDVQDQDLEQWLPALLDGTLDEAQRRQLVERLRLDAQARTRYVSYLMLHGLLRWEFAPRSAGAPVAPVAPEAAARTANAAGPRRTGATQAFRPFRRGLRPWIAVAINAGIALVAVVAWSTGLLPPQAPPAVLAGSEDAVWADGQQRLPGSALDGTPLVLTTGLAQVQLRNGVELLLQAPAELTLADEDAALLGHGRLVARVPPQARGFTVTAGDARVVDLGTEFAVSAPPGGEVVVRVFDGVVELDDLRAPGPATRLTLGAAVRVPAAGGPAVPARAGEAEGFVRVLPGALTDEGLQDGLVGWWPLDETSGTTAADRSGRGHHGQLTNATFAEAGTAGRHGGALSCDGVDTYVSIPHHADFDLGILSISAWVRTDGKLNPDSQVLSKYLAYGMAMPAGGYLKFYFWHMDHILANRFEHQRWQHVCGVFDGRQRVLYVDGATIGAAMSSRPPFSKGPLEIGALRGEFSGNSAFFRGAIDDVRLYGRALSPDEVRRLYLLGERAAGD